MQFEHPKIVVERYQDQMLNMIVEQVLKRYQDQSINKIVEQLSLTQQLENLKSVYQKREVVRVVLQAVMQNSLKEQINQGSKYLY